MEENMYKSEVMEGIEPDTSFIQEVELSYKPEYDLRHCPTLNNSQEVYQYALPFFKPFISHHEEMWIILLNQASKVIGRAQLVKGGLSGVIVDIRIIWQYVIKSNAVQFILIHNHPGGGLLPSECDKALTNKVQKAAGMLDFRLTDHLIVTVNGYYSFVDEGNLF